jgi:hypothetical protein
MTDDDNERAVISLQDLYSFLYQLGPYAPPLHIRQDGHRRKLHAFDRAVLTFYDCGTEEDMPHYLVVFNCKKREQALAVIPQIVHDVRFLRLTECQFV